MNDFDSWHPLSAFKFFRIIFKIRFTKKPSAIIMIEKTSLVSELCG